MSTEVVNENTNYVHVRDCCGVVMMGHISWSDDRCAYIPDACHLVTHSFPLSNSCIDEHRFPV